jgi:mannose-6-phosphate isomerase
MHDAMKLPIRLVEKPWGRTDIPASFGADDGARIGEIWFEHPAGDAAPLMVKFLFTSERLSIQVHPDDEAAQALGYPRGKEECWLVLAAESDAELGVGLNRVTHAEALRSAAEAGTIEAMIDWRPAQAGDFVYNQAGTIHAIGPGMMLVEIQQNVDCTFRLYDYGRPRELHLDAGLAVAHTAPRPDPRDCSVATLTETTTLVDGPHFTLVRAVGPIDAGEYPHTELTVVPLSDGCMLSGAPLTFGECAITDGAGAIALAPHAVALIAWPADTGTP